MLGRLGIGLTLLAGCARDPLEWRCPALAAGDLVVTEVRGPQSGPDSYGEWIELYNASGAAIDLEGAALEVSRLDGSGVERILVRAPQVVAQAGDYTVLGRFAAGAEPAHVDYGFQSDFDTGLYDDAVIYVEACGELIDRAVYRDLPAEGTLGLDGDLEPDAGANDDEGAWCVDSAAGGGTELGLPGTPGERNRPCA